MQQKGCTIFIFEVVSEFPPASYIWYSYELFDIEPERLETPHTLPKPKDGQPMDFGFAVCLFCFLPCEFTLAWLLFWWAAWWSGRHHCRRTVTTGTSHLGEAYQTWSHKICPISCYLTSPEFVSLAFWAGFWATLWRLRNTLPDGRRRCGRFGASTACAE